MKSIYVFYFLVLLKINIAQAQRTITICEGDSTALTTTNEGLDYSWLSSDGLSNFHTRNPIVKPTQTTTYICTYIGLNKNLITNADFNQGNTGFTSEYTNSNNAGFGRYLVTNAGTKIWWVGFSACNDHTNANNTTGGYMMLVDGASDANKNVWCQEIDVLPNTKYAFSAWIQNICTCGSSPRLQFGVNGINLGNIFNVTYINCQWSQFYEIWNSGTNTRAKICLVNQNTESMGNDFAIDDISFAAISPIQDTVIVKVLQKSISVLNADICKGDSLFFNNQYIKKAGIYDGQVYKKTNGCDSIIRLNLTIRQPAYDIVKFDSICRGTSYNFAGKMLNTEGVYQNCFKTVNGEDSLVNLHLNFYPSYNISKKDTICFGDSLLVGSTFYNKTGNYTVKLTSSKGCDSTINLDLFIRPQNIRKQKVYMCHTDILKIGDNIYNKTGIYTNKLRGYQCDSIVITDLEVFIKWTEKIDTSICEGQKLIVNNKTYSTSGHFMDTIPRPYRCDTIFDIHLTVLPLPKRSQNITLCKGESFKINKKTYTQEGNYIDTIKIKNGCDSIIFTTINIIDLNIAIQKAFSIENGDSIQMNPKVNVANRLQWKWSPPDGLSCVDCQNPIATPLTKTQYQLLVKDIQYGCTASDSISVAVNPCTKVYIPNSFSPNDDGINDFFTAYGTGCAKGIKSLSIYNRWGNILFTYRNLPLNADKQGWNGKYKGKRVSSDVYIYVIEIEFGNGSTGIFSGDINIID